MLALKSRACLSGLDCASAVGRSTTDHNGLKHAANKKCANLRVHQRRVNRGSLLHNHVDLGPNSGLSSRRLNRLQDRTQVICGATYATPPSHGFDYYELLGLDSDADPCEIKQAYRYLQKRCHPDVAGDGLGHDMAILLNEAYTILSDPHARAAYDQGRTTWIDSQDYTGRPLHSTWHGPDDEEEAVFVDENSCVGCLQCAHIASNTFAIETKHGRARCIKQWGNDEPTIKAAMSACPVDCIRFVERSKLPALEFMMTKLPRVPVGLDAHSGGGKRAVDVFQAADGFLKKKAMREKQQKVVPETPAQREARQRAASGIQAQQTNGVDLFSLRWWMDPSMAQAVVTQEANQDQHYLVELSPEAKWAFQAGEARNAHSHIPESVRKLHEAAAHRRGTALGPEWETVLGTDFEEYWKPITRPAAPAFIAEEKPQKKRGQASRQGTRPSLERIHDSRDPVQQVGGWWSSLPLAAGVLGAVVVGLTYETEGAQSVTSLVEAPEMHTMSRLMVALSSGLWPHAMLAGVAWYVMAAVAANVFMLATGAVVGTWPSQEGIGNDSSKERED